MQNSSFKQKHKKYRLQYINAVCNVSAICSGLGELISAKCCKSTKCDVIMVENCVARIISWLPKLYDLFFLNVFNYEHKICSA